jgi:hypothetical protein
MRFKTRKSRGGYNIFTEMSISDRTRRDIGLNPVSGQFMDRNAHLGYVPFSHVPLQIMANTDYERV